MTLPNPFPQSVLPIFDVDVEKFFADVSSRILDYRQRRQQPPIVPNGNILVGQEQLPRMDESFAPPMIVAVPTGTRFTASRHIQDSIEPRILGSQWLDCEIHCWGDDDPQRQSTTYAFSTALELWRQCFDAMRIVNRGIPNIVPSGSRWVQRQDTNRNGRVLVVDVGIWSALRADPPIFVPFQTATTPGATIAVVADLTSPDGSQVQEEAAFTTP